MHIALFGASGKVGRQLIIRLLADGHQVTALVHRHIPTEHPELVVVKGDVHDTTAVTKTVSGSEVVLMVLGSWGTPTKDILSAATERILPAMHANGVQRFISLTGSGALLPNEPVSKIEKISHSLFELGAHKIIADAEEHLELLAASGTDWTALRAPIMSSNASPHYQLSDRPAALWQRIPRAAVVQALVDQLSDTQYFCQAPHLRP